ncbi:DUF4377 domain-containing protein [Dysgonomonas macrotermitis]|uniref:DUF4377 domain-containing protein n=1 Tax=Dysgonomonas macrotermitis TaxID=1346286 RepID=A0A1M4Y5I4_9BACT|nr:DUF4377 domain-containing protein [Dysgonomonas macrotermitis]SHF00939.1 protein of unknown function [Dysgonomonas macrotermitis]
MKKLILFYGLVLLAVSACTSSKTTRYRVASEYGDCVGVAPQKCMYVKVGNQADWQFFYSRIEGFNYEEGYEYVLDVKTEKRENTPADASSFRYILVKQISKTRTTSTGLPRIPSRNTGYQINGKVVSIEDATIGRGAAQGQFGVLVVGIEVTSSTDTFVKPGDIVYCELLPSPSVKPVKGREYVFKAKSKHPAHAKGVYFLETDVIDLK